MNIANLIFQRYGNKKIWLTEFAVKSPPKQTVKKIVEFIEEFLPLLEHSDFIYRYSWWIPRYSEKHSDPGSWFWLDSYNSLLDTDELEKIGQPILTEVGKAYDKPWHLEMYNPYR